MYTASDITLPHISPVAKEEFQYEGNQLKDVFKMNTNPRGYCVIVNMREDRTGTEKDAKDLRKVFTKLKFAVKEYTDLTKEEIIQLAKNVEKADHSKLSCFVMFILAHGDTVNNEPFIRAGDQQDVLISTIEKSILSSEGLIGKPKLLFLQSCRGGEPDSGVQFEEYDSTEEESDVVVKIPTDSDFLTAYATVKGRPALRNPMEGSLFIQNLVQILEKDGYVQRFHIMELLTKVRRSVAHFESSRSMQVPQTKETFLKFLYFGKPPESKINHNEYFMLC